MKLIKKLEITVQVVLFVLFIGMIFVNESIVAQQNENDPQTLQKLLVKKDVYIDNLEKTATQQQQLIDRIANDLKKINTKAQLDSLKNVYGLDKPKGK